MVTLPPTFIDALPSNCTLRVSEKDTKGEGKRKKGAIALRRKKTAPRILFRFVMICVAKNAQVTAGKEGRGKERKVIHLPPPALFRLFRSAEKRRK